VDALINSVNGFGRVSSAPFVLSWGRETGDPAIAQSQKVRPEFTAFGWTVWILTERVPFISVVD